MNEEYGKLLTEVRDLLKRVPKLLWTAIILAGISVLFAFAALDTVIELKSEVGCLEERINGIEEANERR